MSTSSSYRGLWLAAIVLAATFAVLVPMPSSEAALNVLEDIQVYTSDNNGHTTEPAERIKNLTFSRLTTWNAAEDQLAPGALHANMSRNNVNLVSVDYGRTAQEIFGCQSRLYFSTNPSIPPQRSGQWIAMNNTAQTCANGPGAWNPTTNPRRGAATTGFLRGEISLRNLSTATSIWFVIEIWDNDGTAGGTPMACDYGRSGQGEARIVVAAEGCQSPVPSARGFKYLLDAGRPVLDISFLIPKRHTGLIATTAPLTAAGATFMVADNESGPIQISIRDTSTGGTGFNTKLNRSSVVIRVGGVLRYCAADPSRPAADPCRAGVEDPDGLTGFWAMPPTANGYQLTYRWNETDGISPDTAAAITIEARDYANNTVGTTAPHFRSSISFFGDTTAPDVQNAWARPTTFQPGAINLTGFGGTVKLNVTLVDPTVNGTATNITAVKGYLFARLRNAGTRPCYPGATSGCLFIAPFGNLSMVRRAAGTNACSGRGTNEACFEGQVMLRNISGVDPSYSSFNVNMSVRVIDAAGNSLAPGFQNFSNVFRVQMGLPVIVPKLALPQHVRTGPYNVSAEITDSSPGIDPDSVKLRIANITGNFTADPSPGWTKVSNGVYEKKFDAQEGNTFLWRVPDATDGAFISYQFRAADQIGNFQSTTDTTFSVDKKSPSMDLVGDRSFRGAPPNTITYATIDSGYGNRAGSQVNASSAMFHFRTRGTATYTDAKMTGSSSLLSGVVTGTYPHKTVIEYWAEVKDFVGNPVTSGTAAAPKNYTIDIVKPTLTMDPPPATNTDGKITITTLATDADSGVDSVTFEGRYKEANGVFTEWKTLANSTNLGLGPMCLAAGVTYEFRAFAMDKAGNVGDRSPPQTTVVNDPGCLEELLISVKQPAGGSLVDAQGGTGTKRVEFSASSTGTFTSSGFIRIQVDFSPDDGGHWVVVASDQPNTGTYNWTVNAPTCERCVIRVVATGPGGVKAEGRSAPFEVINGNPTTDYDNNGLYDGCELRYFRAMGTQEPEADTDQDGLENQQECALGTDPTRLDTDGDGASDGTESKLGHDPLNVNNKPDEVDMRFEEWGNYYLIIPLLFLAVAAVFLLGVARRW